MYQFSSNVAHLADDANHGPSGTADSDPTATVKRDRKHIDSHIRDSSYIWALLVVLAGALCAGAVVLMQ